jgi:hypothetical protein
MNGVNHPVVGFRSWAPQADGVSLSGIYIDHIWTPGVNEAECMKSMRLHRRQDTPANYCECGLYAFHDWRVQQFHGTRFPGYVGGIIRGWGNLRVHHHGWRSQYAEILALFDLGKTAKRSAEHYGVPLVPPRAMDTIIGEFGQLVPVELRPADFRTSPNGADLARGIATGAASLCVALGNYIGQKIANYA